MAVDSLGDDVLLSYESSKLQIRVGDGAMWIAKGHQSGLDLWRELSSPKEGWKVAVRGGRQPHSTHASTRGIMRANCNWMVGDQFRQLRGACREGLGQMLKILELVAHGLGDSNAVAVDMTKAFLEEGEQTSTARNAQRHAAELSQSLVPNLGGHAGLVPQGIEYLLQSLDTVRRQLQGLLGRVNEPT